MAKFIISACFALFCMILIDACKHDTIKPVEKTNPTVQTPENIDSFLVAQANMMANFTWYKGDDSILPSSKSTAHAKYFRVRFNAIANAALTDTFKLPVNGKFPEGSIIVKEVIDSPIFPVKLFAIMMKDSTSAHASKGWVWAELYPNGNNYISAKKKGTDCTGCHGFQSRDYVRLFNLF